MNIGDKIYITTGEFESARTTVRNIVDGGVIVRIGYIDVLVKDGQYVTMEEMGK